jgi:hypothetical protein
MMPIPLQNFRANTILPSSIEMRFAVQLDHEVNLVTVKIGNKISQRGLAAKFVSADLTVAKKMPDQFFGRRGIVAHASGTRKKFRIERRFAFFGHQYALTPALSRRERGKDCP